MSFSESMNILLETMPPELSAQNTTLAAVFFGTLCVWQVVPLLLYMYFASKIIGNFNIINRTLRKRGYVAKFFDDNVKYPEDMHVSLEYLRHMHNMTTKSVYELGKCYGDFMAVDQLCVIVMVITNVCTFINTRSHDIHLIAFTIINVFIVLCVLLISHRIKESVSLDDFYQQIYY
jgi:type IV secretory pathway TrbL component